MTTASSRALVAVLALTAPLVACGEASGPQPPAQVRVSGGDGQVARIGTVLPAPIVVTVLNGDGAPAKGIRVAWRNDGDGRLIPVGVETDAQGQARALWQLGASEGQHTAQAILPGLQPATFSALAEGPDALPFDALLPLDFQTYDGSGQVVHPDYAATPDGVFGQRHHLAVTPYPFGNAKFENPSFFEGARRDHWALGAGAPNPVVLPDVGYLSDPDLVYVPEDGELWLYYRQVTVDNIIRLVRTRDGRHWSTPAEVVRAPNHQIVSPSVVRRAAGDWWMFAVNAGATGCGAAATTVEVRRSGDGLTWGDPVPSDLALPDFWPWHVDVQWIPSRSEFWAVYNGKTAGGCTTPAAFIATSGDGLAWITVPQAVLAKGATAALQDIVYRTTFEFDPATDGITFWFSGARYDAGSGYRWGAAVERRHRADVFESTRAELNPAQLPPAPAPLDDWP